MPNLSKAVSYFAVLIATITFAPTDSYGQGSVLEEITVTAQKREQNLQDVGIAVTAFSGDQLRELGIEDTLDLEAQTPGLLIGEYGGAGVTTTVNIRGVAQLDFADHQESPNAVYVDGSYVSFIGGINVSMFDLERVEVLRGPQGTLFGRNATGGLVHLISKKPSDEFDAYIDVSAGEYSKIRTEGAIGGSLSDSVRGRLSFSSDHHDGYYENTAGPDIVENGTVNLRAQLDFDISDQASLLLSVRHSDTDNVNAGVYHQIGAAPDPANDGLTARITDANRGLLDAFCSGFNGVPTVTPSGGSDCYGSVETSDVFSVSPDLIGFFDRQMSGFTGTLSWELNEDLTLTSITDFQNIDKAYLEDNDSSALPVTVFSQMQDADQFSQEFRLGGTTDNSDWVVGAYYLNIDSTSQQRVDQSPFFDIDFTAGLNHETTSWAIFGQTEYAISDSFSIIGGLRWTEDDKDVDLLNDCVDTDAFGFGGTCLAFGIAVDERTVGTRSDGEWAGKVELDWRPHDDWLWYLGVTRGVKSGVHNATVGAGAGVTLAGIQIEPEILTSIEGGFKATLADGRARLNASIFSYDYEDYQAYQFVGVAVALFNADASLFGGEIEFQVNPIDGLDIVLGAAFLDSEVKNVPLPSGRFASQDMPYAPDLSANGLVRYSWQALGGSVSLQGDFNYVGERFFSTVNHPVQSDGDYIVSNARIGYTSGDERWGASVFVNNFTDVERLAYAADLSFAGGGYGIQSYAPPRWAGVSFTYNWN